jgi:hypothetical protein
VNPLSSALLLALIALAPAQAQEEDEGKAKWGLIMPGTFVVFYDSKGPASYVSMTRKELPADAALLTQEFYGRGCQYGLSVPMGSPLTRSAQSLSAARGQGGFEAALAQIRAKAPGLRGLYDVRIDQQLTSILGFFRRQCVEVTARGYK